MLKKYEIFILKIRIIRILMIKIYIFIIISDKSQVNILVRYQNKQNRLVKIINTQKILINKINNNLEKSGKQLENTRLKTGYKSLLLSHTLPSLVPPLFHSPVSFSPLYLFSFLIYV